MPQLRDIGVKIRAVISIVAVCALMVSVTMSGAAAASAADAVFRNAPAPGGLFACFKRHVTQRDAAETDAAAKDKASGGETGKHHHCPCCLAAGAVVAALPSRVPALVAPRPETRAAPQAIATTPALARAPPPSINGARAPPVII